MAAQIMDARDIQTLLDALPMPVVIVDGDHRMLFVNTAFCAYSGMPREALLAHGSETRLPRHVLDRMRTANAQAFETGQEQVTEERFVNLKGESFHLLCRRRLIELGGRRLLMITLTDLKTFREAEVQNRYLAQHDALTGLADRMLLDERMDQALPGAAGKHGRAALMYIDLDHLKQFNTSFGYACGDALLRSFARRLSGVARGSDTVARLGGDDFAVLLTDLAEDFDADAFCRRVLATIDQPFDVEGGYAHIGASIGLALLGAESISRDEFHRRADIALFESKGAGRNRFRIYSAELDERTCRRRAIERDLRAALRSGEGLAVHYQPVVTGVPAATMAMEALVRWEHPRYGTLGPDEFVPIAEESGLIVPLGEWVLACAAQMMAGWPDVALAVNVSPVQLREPDIAERLLAIADAAGLERERLHIEVTETAIFESDGSIVARLGELRAAGAKVVLDDFGTGYSSLAHLQRVAADRVKIDKSFVARLVDSQDDRAIVQAVLGLGRTLGIGVIAEGVETPAQRDLLASFGCEEFQGYLFAPPLDEATACTFLANGIRAEAA